MMRCTKCGCLMLHYWTDNNFDDKGNKIEQFDYYNCFNCGYDDVKYTDFERVLEKEGKNVL